MCRLLNLYPTYFQKRVQMKMAIAIRNALDFIPKPHNLSWYFLVGRCLYLIKIFLKDKLFYKKKNQPKFKIKIIKY